MLHAFPLCTLWDGLHSSIYGQLIIDSVYSFVVIVHYHSSAVSVLLHRKHSEWISFFIVKKLPWKSIIFNFVCILYFQFYIFCSDDLCDVYFSHCETKYCFIETVRCCLPGFSSSYSMRCCKWRNAPNAFTSSSFLIRRTDLSDIVVTSATLFLRRFEVYWSSSNSFPYRKFRYVTNQLPRLAAGSGKQPGVWVASHF